MGRKQLRAQEYAVLLKQAERCKKLLSEQEEVVMHAMVGDQVYESTYTMDRLFEESKALLKEIRQVIGRALKDGKMTIHDRTDGSSKFTDANKWAGFLSGAFAWRMSEEKFIKDLNIFSNLKFRASYGETGNQGIGSYRTLPMLSVANYPFAGGINSGFAQVDWRGPVADDLRWETTAQYNVGLDMGFLNGRINLTVDYYHKKTRDLLQEVKIPLSTGFANMMVNSGYVTNEGLEISGKFYLLQNTPLKWNIDANISFNKNQIGGLEADQFATRLWYKADEVFLQRNGCPIGTIFGYVEDGFYDNLAEVMADPDPAVRAKGQKMIGEIKYRNFDDNPAITNADRVIIGDTNPDFVTPGEYFF